MNYLKYVFPFVWSLIFFAFIDFSPTDCIPLSGQNSCGLKMTSADEELNFENCTYKGFPLYGKVKLVNHFPDIKVKVVDNFPDIKVKLVNNFPDDCGEWQIVDNFPDVKIQIVESFPDIKVKFVDDFPGK